MSSDGAGLLSGPDIVSRGFVYVRESEQLMEELRGVAADAIEESFYRGYYEWNQIKNLVKDDLSRFIYQRTKRRPMILPIIMEV
jgi:ribonuclease J